MLVLPSGSVALVVRTHFADDPAWERLLEAVETPTEDGFLANVDYVDDPRFADADVGYVFNALAPAYSHPIVVLADGFALASPELPLVVVDLREEPGRWIRVVASELWGIENNLSLANMDFEEFAGAVDEDGVFRGF